MVSKEMENVISMLKGFQKSVKEVNIPTVRAGMDQLATIGKLPKDVKCEPVIAGNVPIASTTIIPMVSFKKYRNKKKKGGNLSD